MKLILLLSDDLLDASRLTGPVRDAGATLRQARDAATLVKLAKQTTPNLVILDLANPGLDLNALMIELQKLPSPPRVVAYGAHVDAAGLKAAREAGCDLVLPRSAFAERVATDLASWLV